MRTAWIGPLALASAFAAGPSTAAPGGSAQLPDHPLVQVVDARPADRLVRLDPRTLLPDGSEPVPTFQNGADAAFSPDGRLLALGSGFGGRARINLVDTPSWRGLRTLALGRRGAVNLEWLRQDRLLAIVGDDSGDYSTRLIDASSGSTIARRSFRGRWLDSVALPGAVAALVAPSRRLGPARLIVLDLEGGIRTIRVDGIRAGRDELVPTHGPSRYRRPGIAADPIGGRVYIVAAGPSVVAEVAPKTGAVAYRRLASTDGASGQPTAAKGNVAIWWRQAAWLGDGRIAVSGDHQPASRPGRRRPGLIPYGVRIIDTSDWSLTTLHPGPRLIELEGERLLATGSAYAPGWMRATHTGLLAYDLDGKRAFERFSGEDVSVLGSHGRRGYVWVRRNRRLHVIDLRSGRTLRSRRVTPGRVPYLL